MLFLFNCCPSGLGANWGYGMDDLLTFITSPFCIEDGTRATGCRFCPKMCGLCALNNKSYTLEMEFMHAHCTREWKKYSHFISSSFDCIAKYGRFSHVI